MVQAIKAGVQKQPVSAAIAANNKYIHSYASGVIDAADCFEFDEASERPVDPLNPVNHAVLIVGYGTDEATGLEYWLIKNSWNSTWGDKGYVKFAMTSNDAYEYESGVCGVYSYPTYPILKEADPN